MRNVMRWSPTGEAKTFASDADVPEGWTDKHPNHYGTDVRETILAPNDPVSEIRESNTAPPHLADSITTMASPAKKPITLRRKTPQQE